MATDLLDLVPGASTVVDLLKFIPAIDKGLKELEKHLDPHIISALFDFMGGDVSKAFSDLDKAKLGKWSHISSFTGTTLVREILHDSLGINVGKFDKDAQSGVDTLDRFMGFIIAITYGGVLVDVAAKTILAGRVPEHLLKPIMELPQEMGLSWAIGTFMETILEAAVGRSIEEGIAEQKRPNRLGWPELRTLFRQHILHPKEVDKWLEKLGYPDDQISLIRNLATNQLTIGDLQAMFLADIKSGEEVIEYLWTLGYSDDDARKLTDLYVNKAETRAGSTYVSAARSLYERELIDETQFTEALKHVNTPKREIDDNVLAVKMLRDNGKILTSISTLKSLYVRGSINTQQAEKELAQLGYSQLAITNTITAWDLPTSARPHGLSQSKILSYYISGILDRKTAHDELVNTNLRSTDVDFLLDHPSAANGVHVRKLAPSTIIEAYMAGAVKQDALSELFKKAGVADTDIEYWISIADYRYANRKHSKGTDKPLSEGQILDAWANGIWDLHTAHQQLTTLGYSDDDATILLEIKNKGIFQPPEPPVFSSVGAAISYMNANGYIVHPPPDPKLTAAEGVLAAAGYTWEISTGITPRH